ncbi:FxsA family membrane protein [Streptomyces sp. NPDC048172]|uniref:FxsA family membrane protein n=1 Tax=Streptomyces sp. NPDC048172 TaxID=3365505 RepID=UPI0037144F95
MTTRAPFPYEPQDEQSGPGGPGGPEGSGAGGRKPRRSRARTFLPLAVAAWVVLEIWLFMLVAEATSGLLVLLLIVAGFVLGAALIKRAGRRAWRNLAETVQRAQDQARAGTPPDEESLAAGKGEGNGTAMLGGLLIMIPGMLSDVAGLLLLFPPTAKLLRGAAKRSLERPRAHAPGSLGDAYQQARSAEEQVRMHRPDGKVVQGEVVRDDEPPTKG